MNLSDKKVLVTGADGFIGSHLTELLVREGADVRALALYNSFNSWGWLEDVECIDQVEVVNGDVRDPSCCRKLCKDVDVVFHLAALISIPYSYQAPDSYVSTNVSGTLNMCQAALDEGCERFMQTSTSEVYGTAQYVPIDENHPLQPQSPYSATKIGADSVAMSFYNSFDLPLTVARPFNTYGPRQSARAVIPTIITQIAAGKKKVKLGDLRPTRDFNYVEDTCRAMMVVAASDKCLGEVVNIGSNKEISVGDLFETIKDIMHSDVVFKQEDQRFRPKNSEVLRLWCENAKLRELTGYEYEFTLRAGLERTVEWFTNPDKLGKYKVDIYNV